MQFCSRRDSVVELESLDWAVSEPYHIFRLQAKALPPSILSCQSSEFPNIRWKFGKYDAELFPSRAWHLEIQLAQELQDLSRGRFVWISSMLCDLCIIILELNNLTGKWARAGMFLVDCWYWVIEKMLGDVDWTWFEIE